MTEEYLRDIINKGYITDVTFAAYYLDPANADVLGKLTTAELLDKKIVSQLGLPAEPVQDPAPESAAPATMSLSLDEEPVEEKPAKKAAAPKKTTTTK